MKRPVLTAFAIALAAGPALAAQLYRWVDEKGRVEWRDTPPPADAKTFEQRKLTPNTIESSAPYALQQAMKKYPVPLWTADCGEACSQASAHLTRRGIPHTVRDAQKEREGL